MNETMRTAIRPQFAASAKLLWDANRLEVSWNDKDHQVQSHRIEWASVDTVVTWKDDVFSYDVICLGFRGRDTDLVIDEAMDGWAELLEKVTEHLPGFPEDPKWWNHVAIPAFATNYATIWTRPSPSDEPSAPSTPGNQP